MTKAATFLSSRVHGVWVSVSGFLLLSHMHRVRCKKRVGCPRNLEAPSAHSGTASRIKCVASCISWYWDEQYPDKLP